MTRGIERLYALLLWLYPPPMRREFSAEMRRCAGESLRRRGLSGAPRLFLDLSTSVPREWVRTLPAPRPAGVLRDVGYAARVLARSPRFTATAVLTLALGIGANTAIFTLLDATLLRPVRAEDPDRLVGYRGSLSYPDYRTLAADTGQVFTGLLGSSGSGRLSARIDGSTEILTPSFVSGNYFDVLGVPAALGRALRPSDDLAGAPIVGVLSDDWFHARFAGDPSVVGATIWISGEPVTVVGVAPPGFRGTSLYGSPRFFVPLASMPRLRTGFFSRPELYRDRDFMFLSVTGRLQPGVTPQQAASAMASLLGAAHPPRPGARPEPVVLAPLAQRALGGDNAAGVRSFVWLLLGVVGTTLLIGCANLANLLLARAASRRREITVRLALGASRGRILRQLLVESLLLAGLGAAAGLYVAEIALQALERYQLPGGIEIANLHLGIGGPALAFTLTLAVATAVLFGIAPAVRAAGSRPTDLVREGSRAVTGRGTLRAALVSLQLALSVLLLTGSALFVQSLTRALRVPLGFDVDHVATASVNLEAARYDRARAAQFYDDSVARLRQLPGVRSAAWTTVIPIVGASMWNVELEGSTSGPAASATFYNADVGPDYFSAAGTRILEGRSFTSSDDAGAPAVAVVNDEASRRFWGGQALGRHVRIGQSGGWAVVVGIAETTKTTDLTETPQPSLYLPMAQSGGARLDAVNILVRVDGEADAALPMVASTLRAAAPEVPLYAVETFADRVRVLVMPMRMGAALLTAFSALAVALALVGVYGVTAFTAAQRTREIGIRLALGARRSEIIRLMLRQGGLPVAAGVSTGLVAAYVSARLAAAFMFGISPRDPLTLASVGIGLAVVATLATYLPARRAARLDPVAALRDD